MKNFFTTTEAVRWRTLGEPFARTLGLALVLLATLAFSGCDSKANKASCGPYYAQILKLEAAEGHPAVLSALRTGAGKQAVVEHCLLLRNSQVQCAAAAGTKAEALRCETNPRSRFDRYVKPYLPR